MNVITKKQLVHTHAPDEAKCEARRVRSALRESIISNPHQATTKLCRSQMLNANSEVLSYLPCEQSLATGLRHHRGKLRPPLPKSAADLVIPETLSRTKTGERFLLHSEVVGEAPFVVYLRQTFRSLTCVCRKRSAVMQPFIACGLLWL